MSRNAQCLYVGPDWILYICPAGYDYSEMVAPGIILSKPDSPSHYQASTEVSFQAYGLLHASNVCSKADAEGVLILYLDPLSLPGRSITQALGGEPFKPLTKPHPDWSVEIFQSLCSGDMPANKAIALVESCIALYVNLEITPKLDERFIKVRQLLADSDGGRVQLEKLAESVCLSAVHLRQSFKRQAGMTLSGYKTWLQFLKLLESAKAQEDGTEYSWRIGNTLRDAGFYDDAHGLRTMQRYFGARSTMKQFKFHFVDCRNHQA